MKIAILIAAVLYVPLVTIGTLAAMIYAKRGRSRHPNGIRELVVVAAVLACGLLALPLLFVWSAVR